jgi:hypothetical protein
MPSSQRRSVIAVLVVVGLWLANTSVGADGRQGPAPVDRPPRVVQTNQPNAVPEPTAICMMMWSFLGPPYVEDASRERVHGMLVFVGLSPRDLAAAETALRKLLPPLAQQRSVYWTQSDRATEILRKEPVIAGRVADVVVAAVNDARSAQEAGEVQAVEAYRQLLKKLSPAGVKQFEAYRLKSWQRMASPLVPAASASPVPAR